MMTVFDQSLCDVIYSKAYKLCSSHCIRTEPPKNSRSRCAMSYHMTLSILRTFDLISIPSCLRWRSDSIGHLGLHIRHYSEEVVDYFGAGLAAGVFDGLHLRVRVRGGVFFGFFVAACVLKPFISCGRRWCVTLACGGVGICWGLMGRLGRGKMGGSCTSFSNFLNSSSFCARYSSISFWASLRASFTRLVRSWGLSEDVWSRVDVEGLGGGTFSRCRVC